MEGRVHSSDAARVMRDPSVGLPSEAAIEAATQEYLRALAEAADRGEHLTRASRPVFMAAALKVAYAMDALGADAVVAARIDALTEQDVFALVPDNFSFAAWRRELRARLLREEPQ